MIERQSSEIEYRQKRLMAEAANRRLAASKVDNDTGGATRARSRRPLAGVVAAVLRNLGVFAVLCAALLVSGCSTGQAAAPSSRSGPSAPVAVGTTQSLPTARPDDPLPAGTGRGPVKAHRQ